MSKMMGNLARVKDEAEPEKKPSLFLVREQAAPNALPSSPRANRNKIFAVWGAVACALAVLGFFFYQSFPQSSEAIQISRVAPARADTTGALSQIRSGNFAEAKRILDSLVRSEPGNRAHRINRAFVLKELGKLAEAEGEYKALLAASPADPVVLNNLGALYLKASRLQEAEVILFRAAAAGHADAGLNLAAAFERQKKWEQALKIFEDMLAADAAPSSQPQIRERVRRLRSLAVATSSPKEKL